MSLFELNKTTAGWKKHLDFFTAPLLVPRAAKSIPAAASPLQFPGFQVMAVLHPQGQGEVGCHRDEGSSGLGDRQVKLIPGEFMAQVLALEFSGWCSSLESCSSALSLYLMWIQC